MSTTRRSSPCSPSAGRDPLFESGAARLAGRSLSVVFKAAAEIGELGDNTRAMREAITADGLLRAALAGERAQVAVLGHTRWASVGIVSEPNAHPVNSDELEQPGGAVPPFVVGVLNGDVDNHAELRAAHSLHVAGPITTDAKVIPALVARHAGSVELFEAFRRTVSAFEGSVAIGAAAAAEPGRLLLALNGSGQGVYVGPRRGPLPRRQRALRGGRGDGPVRAARRRARRPGAGPRRPVRRDDRRHGAAWVRRLGAAGDRGRRRDGGGHDARHRPGRLPALPAEGADGVAGQPGQDAARQDRRARRPAAGGGRRPGPAGGGRGAARRRIDHPHPRHRPGHRSRGRAVDGRGARRARRRVARRGRRHGHRAVGLRPAPGHGRHPGHRREPERHDDRHQPHRRPAAQPRRRRAGDRQPALQRPHRQGRRRAVHVRRARRGDERGVDEGVLRPGGRRLAAGVRGERRRRRRHRSASSRAAGLPAPPAGRAARGAGPSRRHRRRRSPAGPREALLGGRRQRHQQGRRRGGPDQAERALLQVDRLRRHRGQEAHRSLVRAADPRLRRRPHREHGRRRRQGGRDLPRPQGDADRHRRRR